MTMTDLDYDYLAQLVIKTQDGNSDAFAELYTATYKKQFRFTCRYVKDEYLAQDILQEVYILVLKNIRTLKNPRLFVSWLNQINFRLCFDAFKKSSLQLKELTLSDESLLGDLVEESDSANPESFIEGKDPRSEIMQEVLALKPKETQAIIMRYYNDMTVEEIADAMDCSRSTVKRSLSNGKARLRKLLQEKKGEDFFGN